MTTPEFKDWFKDFLEAVQLTPTERQWERVKDEIANIDAPAPLLVPFVQRHDADNPLPYTITVSSGFGSVMPSASRMKSGRSGVVNAMIDGSKNGEV